MRRLLLLLLHNPRPRLSGTSRKKGRSTVQICPHKMSAVPKDGAALPSLLTYQSSPSLPQSPSLFCLRCRRRRRGKKQVCPKRGRGEDKAREEDQKPDCKEDEMRRRQLLLFGGLVNSTSLCKGNFRSPTLWHLL